VLEHLKTLKLRTFEKLSQTKLIKSGTTVLAFKCKDGIIAAGDLRASYPGYEMSEYCKVERLSEFSVIAAAGTVACIQELYETMSGAIRTIEKAIGEDIHIDGQACFLRSILRDNFKEFGVMSEMLDYSASPFICGYNPMSGSFHIFRYDGAGAMYESDNYISLGSGSRLATAILDDQWALDISLEDGAFLAVRAISRASRDLYTSPPALYPVTVSIITSSGIQELTPKETLQMAWTIFIRDMQRRGDNDRMSYFWDNISNPPSGNYKKKKRG